MILRWVGVNDDISIRIVVTFLRDHILEMLHYAVLIFYEIQFFNFFLIGRYETGFLVMLKYPISSHEVVLRSRVRVQLQNE